jgi:hypothetical protein
VLLPLSPLNNYAARVIIMGGSQGLDGSAATSSTEIVDFSVPSPSWVCGQPMTQGRAQQQATILPTGRILVYGGSAFNECPRPQDTTVTCPNPGELPSAEIYDPASGIFTPVAQPANFRLYHSTGLLLPDARIVVMGGNVKGADGTFQTPVEVYSPSYLFNSDGSLAARPMITAVPTGPIDYGTTFQVPTPDAASISSVALIRPGAATHAFDMEQRMVSLSFTTGNGVLTITSPPNPNIAPPGFYMLFLVNSAGVPSVGSFVQMLSSSTQYCACTFALSPASSSIPSGGGAGNVTVTAQAGCGWTASSNVSWITISGGSPGSGSGTLSYGVRPNLGTTARSGTITVGDSTFVVTQSAPPACGGRGRVC